MSKPKTILIVEDEALLLESIAIKSRQYGFRTLCAKDAEQGMEMLKKETPDLIWLDVLLPGMNGIEMLEKIRNSTSPAIRDIPVVIVSVSTSARTRLKAVELGISGYIVKGEKGIDATISEVSKILVHR